MTFYLTYILTFYLALLLTFYLKQIPSGILHDIKPDILSDILFRHVFGSLHAQTAVELAMNFWGEIAPLGRLALAVRSGPIGAHSDDRSRRAGGWASTFDKSRDPHPTPVTTIAYPHCCFMTGGFHGHGGT